MLILSIDIGIKNLAHCLLNIEDKVVTIVDWEVVNLTSESSTCVVCGKKALFRCPLGCYCKTHTRKVPYFLPLKDQPLCNISKKSLPELISIVNDYQKTKPTVKIEVDQTNKTRMCKSLAMFKNTKLFQEIRKPKANDYDLVTLGKTIQQKYGERFQQSNIDYVLIENQLGNIAPRMKCIQGMVTQYFIMKDINKIEFVSATNKLKRFIGKQTTYNERKRKGIEITRNAIDREPLLSKWQTHFKQHQKKDDLSDAFLQGIWYLENNILNAEYLKL